MFNSITWELFVTSFAGLIGSYYFITTLLLYHKEITQWVKSRLTGSQSLTLQPSDTAISHTQDILGAANNETRNETRNENKNENKRDAERTSVVESEDIAGGVTDDEPDTITTTAVSNHHDALLIGSVADLLNEIKTLIQLSAEYQSGKEECADLFKASLLKYPHLKGTTYQYAINGYICEESKNQFAFDLTLQEVAQWWS